MYYKCMVIIIVPLLLSKGLISKMCTAHKLWPMCTNILKTWGNTQRCWGSQEMSLNLKWTMIYSGINACSYAYTQSEKCGSFCSMPFVAFAHMDCMSCFTALYFLWFLLLSSSALCNTHLLYLPPHIDSASPSSYLEPCTLFSLSQLSFIVWPLFIPFTLISFFYPVYSVLLFSKLPILSYYWFTFYGWQRTSYL